MIFVYLLNREGSLAAFYSRCLFRAVLISGEVTPYNFIWRLTLKNKLQLCVLIIWEWQTCSWAMNSTWDVRSPFLISKYETGNSASVRLQVTFRHWGLWLTGFMLFKVTGGNITEKKQEWEEWDRRLRETTQMWAGDEEQQPHLQSCPTGSDAVTTYSSRRCTLWQWCKTWTSQMSWWSLCSWCSLCCTGTRCVGCHRNNTQCFSWPRLNDNQSTTWCKLRLVTKQWPQTERKSFRHINIHMRSYLHV